MASKEKFHLKSEIDSFNLQKDADKTSPSEVNIICVQCRDRVGKIVPRFTDLPLRGSMILPHVGTESWPLPMPADGPRDFVCPHAQEEGGDMHLFLNVIEANPDLSDHFLTDQNEFYQIKKSSGECPCGCGGRVRGSNKYSDGLNCYKIHVAQLKKETD